MTAIEVTLLLIGVVFILGSFFIIEKLSPTELSRVSELSEDELRIVMDRELEITGAKISDMADQAVDLSMSQIQRKMEKDTNEKIMAISEYSDAVMEKLQKFNNEVTFLYSMLGDKHTELNESMAQLNELLHACQTVQVHPQMVQPQMIQAQPQTVQAQPQAMQAQPRIVKPQPQTVSTPKNDGVKAPDRAPDQISGQMDEAGQPEITADQAEMEAANDMADEADSTSIKDKILERYRNGEDLKDVARDLGLGYGEVKLIVELYKGEENQ